MIAKETIADIKERTDLVALVSESVKLVRKGRSFSGLCPFHKEKSPSFYVHPERGFYHCFGCGESGSAIDFVMKTAGLDFIETVRLLGERMGIRIEETTTREAREKRSDRDELFGAMQMAATYYEEQLGLSSVGPTASAHLLSHYARAELMKRGMPSGNAENAQAYRHTAQAFRLGYAPASWGELAAYLTKQGVSAQIGERAGLLIAGPRGHYDRFRHRLMFAVSDTLGRVVAFSGRSLPAPTREELAKLPSAPNYDDGEAAKYINSPESPIYKKGEHVFGLYQAKSAVRDRGESLVVEGNFDVFSLHANGVGYAVAPLGTAFTTEQAKLLKRFAPIAVLLFDADRAGRKATRAARLPCREGGLDAKVASLPAGADPDDFVRSRGAAALEELVDGARGLLDYLIQDALDGEAFRGASISEQGGRVRAVAKLLSEEQDPSLRLMAKRYADHLSSKLVVHGTAVEDLRVLERMIDQALSGHVDGPSQAKPRRRVPTPREEISLRMLGIALDFPPLVEDEEDAAYALDNLEGDFALGIAALRQFWQGSSSRTWVEDFLAALPRSIQKFATGRLAFPVFEEIETAKAILLENSKKLTALRWQEEDSEARNVLERSGASLDAESEELLRQIEERARKKRGIRES